MFGFRYFVGGRLEARQEAEKCISEVDEPQIYIFMNPHSWMTARINKKLREVCKSAILFCDGVGVYLVEKWLFGSNVIRLTGLQFTQDLLHFARLHGVKLAFVGSSPEVLNRLSSNLDPRIDCTFFSPPYRTSFGERECDEIANFIDNSEAKVAFLGLTAPKQELLAVDLRERCPGVSFVCVGAVFEYLAKTKSVPPRAIRALGFEWAWRLAMEPGRLWRRTIISGVGYCYCVVSYLVTTTLFKIYSRGLAIGNLIKAILLRRMTEGDAWFYWRGSFLFRAPKAVEGKIMWEIGGYEGFFTKILALRNPKSDIVSFEPVKKFHAILGRLADVHANIRVENFGVGGASGPITFFLEGDASRSDGSDNADYEVAEVRDVDELLVEPIYFLSMNIEGGEYPVINRLAEVGKLQLVQILQIQFHFYTEYQVDQYQVAQNLLGRTHRKVWQAGELWEEWHLKQEV